MSASSQPIDFSRHQFYRKTSRDTILGTHTVGLGYVVVMFVLLFWLEMFEVIPILFTNSVGLLATNLILFIYIMINAVGNYFYVVTTDTEAGEIQRGARWRFLLPIVRTKFASKVTSLFVL